VGFTSGLALDLRLVLSKRAGPPVPEERIPARLEISDDVIHANRFVYSQQEVVVAQQRKFFRPILVGEHALVQVECRTTHGVRAAMGSSRN
jgi:hypothetical protein